MSLHNDPQDTRATLDETTEDERPVGSEPEVIVTS